jgi:hypothetical protein
MNWQIFSSLASGASILYLGLTFALTAFLIGRPLFMRGTGSPGRGWEDGVFSVGLGAGAMALGIFFLGVIGLWLKPVLVLITLAVFGIGLRANRDLWKDGVLFKKTDPSSPWWTRTDLLLGGGLLVVFLFWIPFVLSPETFYDSLTNHLLLPWQWLQAGRLSHLPFNCTSGFPSNTEMLYLLSLAFSDERLAKTVHYLFAVGTALVLISAGARYATRRAGLLGALLFLTLPLDRIEFGTTAVEFSGTFFTLLSVLSLLRSFNEAHDSPRRRWLLLAGIFSGFAMGTKYTLWVFPWAVGISLALFPGLLKQKVAGALRLWAVYFLAPSAVLVLPWVVKNLIYFKNPVYPFLTGLFVNPEAAFYNRGAFFSYAVHLPSLLSIRDALSQYVVTPFLAESKLGWFWAACIALVLLIPILVRRPTWRFVLALFLVQWVAYGSIVHLVRYRFHALALLSLLMGAAFDLAEIRRLRGMLLAGLAALCVVNFARQASAALEGEGWKAGVGLLSKREFLSGTRALYPNPPYAGIHYINGNTPPDAGVLVLGEARTFYLERTFLSSTIYDVQPVQAVLKKSNSAEDVYQRLRQGGTTHLFINLAEAYRLRGQWAPWTPSERIIFQDFMKAHCRLVFEDRHLEEPDFRHTLVYELTDGARPDAATERVGGILAGFMDGNRNTLPTRQGSVPERS